MLKYWVLGQHEKALQQSQAIWSAYRHPTVRASTKPVVTPWLKQDWKAFVSLQQKDFAELWLRARKNGTVLSKSKQAIAVSLDRYQIEQFWCWAHCGMALLAYRRGIEVATDLFWFPPHALKCVDRRG